MHRAGIDQIPVDLAGARRRPDPEDTVLAVQHDIAIGGTGIGDQGRQTDAVVHISAVGKVSRGPPSDLATFLKHHHVPIAFGGNPRGDQEWLSELALEMSPRTVSNRPRQYPATIHTS